MTQDSYALMAKNDIAFVISHSGGHFPYKEVVTSENIYFRFHGPTLLYNSKYDNETMKKYSKLFGRWLRQGHNLWIFFNNDWYGYGIDNALTLRAYLKKITKRAPVG
jgi:uncharacterized protein YecE (DUF72 family)